MTRWLPALGCLTLQAAFADAPAPPAWTHQLVGDITANQVALKDWAQGGDNAFAWGFTLNGTTLRTALRTDWTTGCKLAFGQNKLGDQAVRKTVDRIEVESALTYKLGGYVDPYLKGTFKSQLLRGYKYGDGPRTAVSDLFDPATFTQSAGAGVRPLEQAKTKVGLALREIVTRDFVSYTDDARTPAIEEVRVDGGLESVTDVAWNLADNVLVKSKVEVFVPVTEPGDATAGNDAALTVMLSQYITLNASLEVRRDPTASADLQLKQTTALGLRYNLF